MRRLKLLLAACALMLGTCSMWAYQTPTANGIYYLYNTACTDGTPGFMSSGNGYGFQVVIDNFGFPLKLVSTGADNTYKFQFIHHEGWLSDDGWMYSDGDEANRARTITVQDQGDGKYKLLNTNNGKEIEDWYGNVVGDGTGSRHNYLWQFLSKDERDAMIAGYTTSVKLAAATSMGMPDVDTEEKFDAYLQINYRGVDQSSKIQNGTFDTGHNTQGWTTHANSNREFKIGWGNTDPKTTPEVYEGAGYLDQTVTVDKVGLYKVTVNATYRCGNSDNNNRIGGLGYDGSVAYLKANDNIAKVPDWYSGKINGNGPDSPSEANSVYFSAGKYLTEVFVYVGEEKTINISLHSHAHTWGGWLMFNNFKLTYYSDQVSDDDISALVATIPSDSDIPDAVASNLAALKSALQSAKTIAAYNALSEAIDNTAPIVTAYSRYKTIKTAVLAINNDIDVAAADAIAEAATTTEGVENAVVSVRGALTAYLAAAGITNDKIDLTAALIDNASPGTAGTTAYWTNSTNPSLQYSLYEFYKAPSATSKQAITPALPIGYYTLTVVGYTRVGYDSHINAGGHTQTLVGVAPDVVNTRNQGNSWIAAGNGINAMTFELTEATSNLEIGITSGSSGDNWTCWRSFKLEYLGTAPLAKFQNDLAAAVKAATDHSTALLGSVPMAALTAYNSAISSASAVNSTIEECLQSISDIEAATAVVDALVEPTTNYYTLRTAVNNLYEVSDYVELVSGSHETLGTALSTAATDIENATTVSGINTITSTLKAAGITYAGAANPTESAQFDLTFMLTNPDLTPFYTGGYNVHPAGWNTEQADGNYQVIPSEAAANDDGIHKYCYEYWSYNAKANDKFNLYTAVTLPEGTYTMNCYAFARQQDGEAGKTPVTGVYFYANNTAGDVVTDSKLTQKSISFVNDAEQEVKIGLKAMSSGNTYNWMGIGYVQLYKDPEAAPVELDESTAYDYSYSGAAKAKLTRTISEGFNTVMLPFSLSEEEITDVLGEGTLYAFTGADLGSLNFATRTNLLANTPYLFKANAAKSLDAVEINGRTFVAADAAQVATEGVDYNFVGTYTPYEKNADANPIVVGSDYILGTDAAFHKTTVKNALKAFRAYIKANEETADARLSIFIDGTVTSIDAIDGRVLNNAAIYNIAGQQVKNAQKGIYIQNGKKIVVK